MRAVCEMAMPVPASVAQAFEAAIGVVQNTKSLTILAAHNEGRVLVAYESSKLSNAKIYVISVQEHDSQTVLGMSVGSDPRTSKAVLDGRFNKKSAIRFGQAVQGALDGTAPAPATPVPNHYMHKRAQVPWTDPDQEPDIDLGFSWLALVTHLG